MISRIIDYIRDRFRGVPLGGIGRNPGWHKFVKELIKERGGKCEITGSTRKLVGHHKIPFHIRPDLEMIKTNVIILSEDVFGSNIHLLFGHLGNYKKYNPDIKEDAVYWNKKLSPDFWF